MYLYTGLAFIVSIGIILFIPFRIILRYRLLQGDDDLSVEIVWLGIPWFKFQIPLLSFVGSFSDHEKKDSDEVKANRDMEEIGSQKAMDWRRFAQEIQTVRSIHRRYQAVFDVLYVFAYGKPPDNRHMPLGRPILGYLVAFMYPFTRHFERLYWYTSVGLGDAAATAVAVGALSGLKAAGFLWLQQRVYLDPNKISWQVLPNYSKRQLDMTIDCILRVNAGHIIITGVANLLRVGIAKALRWKTQPVH